MKNDLLKGCNDRGLPLDEFTAAWCSRCKQPDCSRAAFGSPLMEQRVKDQVRRLLHPERADPNLPKYAQIVSAGFKDMLHRAVQLEVSDQRGDWEIPEIPILDGQVHVSPATAVDAAVRAMKGNKAPTVSEQVIQTMLEDPEGDKAAVSVEPDPDPAEPSHPPTPVIRPTSMNTATPQGVVIGDEPIPEPEPSPDPWAIPDGPIAKEVEVGATVKMGGGK